MHDRTSQPGQRRNNETTGPAPSHPEVTEPTVVDGVTWTAAGLQLDRADWMSDEQWDFVRTSMTSWWDGFWAGFRVARDVAR